MNDHQLTVNLEKSAPVNASTAGDKVKSNAKAPVAANVVKKQVQLLIKITKILGFVLVEMAKRSVMKFSDREDPLRFNLCIEIKILAIPRYKQSRPNECDTANLVVCERCKGSRYLELPEGTWS